MSKNAHHEHYQRSCQQNNSTSIADYTPLIQKHAYRRKKLKRHMARSTASYDTLGLDAKFNGHGFLEIEPLIDARAK